MSRRLYDIAHCRAGDKGNTSILSVIAYRKQDYAVLVERVTAQAVARHMRGIVAGDVHRYELPNLGALQFVCERALSGGVTTSLALDAHGKSLSFALLEMTIDE
jgi:non-ribosomal peptide synthetase component E (peptide arylation enzyme)